MLSHSQFRLNFVATSDLAANVQPLHFLDLKFSPLIF